VAVRSETENCSRFIAYISGSNPADGMDVRLSCLLCVGMEGPLRRADQSFVVVLPFVCVCVCACDSEREI
jgi:hypothetical protein